MIPMHSFIIEGPGIPRRRMNRADLTANLHVMADWLFEGGWTVIGSRFKTPNLHPWKDVAPEQLLAWAHENFDSGLANSINLRLDGTDVVALDADFPDPKLAAALLTELGIQGITEPGRVYTVQGGKGFKLFLHMTGQKPSRLPAILGPVGWPRDHVGDKAFKNNVELKTDLSTVYGAYPSEDWLYSEYPDTYHIVHARVCDVPVCDWSVLDRIAAIVTGLMEREDFVAEDGGSLRRQGTHDMLISVLCYAITLMREGRSLIGLSDFLIFAGAYGLAAAVSDFVHCADDPLFPERPPEFTLLEENSPLRAGVMRAWGLLTHPEPELTETMAGMVKTFFAPQVSWLATRLMRAGVSPEHLDILETYDLWRRTDYAMRLKAGEQGRDAA